MERQKKNDLKNFLGPKCLMRTLKIQESADVTGLKLYSYLKVPYVLQATGQRKSHVIRQRQCTALIGRFVL